MLSFPPEVWVLRHLSLYALQPCVQRRERHKTDVGLGGHLTLGLRKRRGKVVKVLQHFHGELGEAVQVRGLK